ncbi:type I polyketide synthase [Kitasatospora cheerisanensis]|uniref:type I polyketide synthase n=1 Tax=Kitasatospora cheerisanensis TaxID=81942 RepID=UPI003CC5CB6D
MRQVLRARPGQVAADVPFQNLGFDSLMAIELRGRLETALGLRLSATLVYAYPTVEALTEQLLARLEPPAGPAAAPAAAAPAAPGRRPGRPPPRPTWPAWTTHRSRPCSRPSWMRSKRRGRYDRTHRRRPTAAAGTGVDQTAGRAGPARRGRAAPHRTARRGRRGRPRPGGVEDLDALWRLLDAGTDAVTPWLDDPAGRRDGTGRPTGLMSGQLARVDGFDAAFFGIGSEEADRMDPQQRLVLEAAWEAVEDAGLPVERLRERSTGVFLGLYGADYLNAQLAGQADITAWTAPGGAHSIAANRLSYLLDLHGPSLAVDTACSSSLVALHLAARALRAGECDFALVGGVNLVLAESMMNATGKVLPLATGGRCRTFDAAADGIVRSEGCGILLLERLSDARAHGRRVRGVVRGTAVNHNGRANGLTAPSPRAQGELLRRALDDAAADAADVLYVEAHGTGTRLGDPIEVEALREVYGAGEQPCAIGSVKTNFGHQEAAAGIIGLLKALLVLDRGQVPPHLHLERLNPEIDLDGSRLTVPTVPTALPERPGRLAAVSSFGFGGTNAHVILEGPPGPAAPPEPPPAPPGRLLLPLSARSAPALGRLAAAYAERLAGLDDAAAAELCAAAVHGRSHHAYRIAPAGADAAALAAELAAVWPEFLRPHPAGHRVAFVFSGQGTQWAGMGRDLLEHEPVVRAEAERCDAVVRELAGWSVLDELAKPEPLSRMHETEIAQVCIAVLQLGLAALWRSWGVEPDAVAGHSMGEIVAACAAGALDRRQAFELMIARARITEAGARGGAMSGIALPVAEVAPLVAEAGGRIAVAAVNGPRSTVVAGDPDKVTLVEAAAAERGARTRRLPVEYAFHSPLLDGCDTVLADRMWQLTPRVGGLPQYSTVTGDRVRAADLGPAHWGRNLREPVLFAGAVDAMARDGVTVFVEIGPHPVLQRDMGAVLEGREDRHTVVGSLRRAAPARDALGEALGELYRAGLALRWDAVLPPPARHVPLPPYPWQRRRHWFEPHPVVGTAPAGPRPAARPDAADTADAAPTARQLADRSPAELEETLVRYVCARVAAALGLDADADIPVDRPLDVLGLGSLAIVELKNRIERDFAVAVPLQALLEEGTPLALARTVAKSLAADAASAAGPGPDDDPTTGE